MFFNIDYSINDLKTQSNASDVVLTKKYSNSNPIYKYEHKDENGNLFLKTFSRNVTVSNYSYNSTLPINDASGFANNVIFPYSTDDFKNIKINSVDKVGVAPYDDESLSRYTNRKKGILRTNPTNISLLGVPIPQNINRDKHNT
ncbi:MAG: hypothetical protein RSB95_04935, partial [Bacilli bacterium]